MGRRGSAVARGQARGIGSSQILDSISYRPASIVTYSTASSTFSDVDATNAALTFTAPSSGVVLIEFEFYAKVPAVSTARLAVNLRVGTSDVSASARRLMLNPGSVSFEQRCHTSWKVTGLTAGTEYTYKLGWASSDNSSTINMYAGSDIAGALTGQVVGVPAPF